jgi:S1-C subfamily serine protease
VTGALVLASEPGSPAHRAGLKEGDVIVSLDDEAVEGVDVLHRLLDEERINKETKFIVLRGSRQLELKIIPEVRPS